MLTAKQYIYKKIIKKKSGCWEWQGCYVWKGKMDKKGYGLATYNHKYTYAHRFVWKVFNGEIPKKLCVLHKCDNPCCVNPKHLFLGTRYDNNIDRIKKGRGKIGIIKREAVIDILFSFAEGKSIKDLAIVYNVSHKAIERRINRFIKLFKEKI